jgi:hypothetical protein
VPRDRLRAFDVDLERVAGQVLRRHLQRSGARLSHHDREDLHAYLVSEGWRISLSFDPSRDRLGAAGFSSYICRVLDRRVADFYRGRFGDARYFTVEERERFGNHLSLDAPAADGGDSLGSTVAGGDGDFAANCGPDLGRLLAAGSESRAEDQAIIRELAS